MPVVDHQRTTLIPETGNITFYQRPIVAASAKGQYSIASMFWQIFNRTAADGSPFVHVRRFIFQTRHTGFNR